MNALLIFPHQLYENHPGFASQPDIIAVTEDPLFFKDEQYPVIFHRQKLMLHRASMQQYANSLRSQEYRVAYFESIDQGADLSRVLASMAHQGVTQISVCDVVDFMLKRRLTACCADTAITLRWLCSPGFINTDKENHEYRSTKKRWFMADFYKAQRRRLNILVHNNEPVGGKWSFDEENRKKIPKKKLPEIPRLTFEPEHAAAREARQYVATHFPNAFGNEEALLFPSTHAGALKWLEEFLDYRFAEFGPYEDAIVEDENWLYHSVLTPMLNIGLLTPSQVISETLAYATNHDTPMASVEGFVRQIIGWREFMRATYVDLGVNMRTTNHWSHSNAIPKAFYTGNTQVLPVDNTIKRILRTGYCHHIERLMVLGGFMFLCEINPDDIYKWFMEMFVDSYDWVMVPNVYAMSQHADGGQITTKPYFSGSNYICKMSHYVKGEWSEVWDALYWRWIFKHAHSLAKQPRWAMMVRNAQKMDIERKTRLLATADAYLLTLRGES